MKSKWVMILVLAVVAMVAGLLWSQRRSVPLKVSGFVEADEIRVGSRVGGRVAKVPAVEGARVAAGDVLLELDPFDLPDRRAKAAAELQSAAARLRQFQAGNRAEEIAQAKARAEQASAMLEQLQAGPRREVIAVGEARVREAEALHDRALVRLKRTQEARAQNALAEDDLTTALGNELSAAAVLEARRQELAELQAGTRSEEIAQAQAAAAEALAAYSLSKAGYRSEEVAQAQAAADAAKASLDAIDRQIVELTVRSPLAGIVEAVDLQPGDLLAANAPAMSILDPSRLWVRAYVPEDHLAIDTGREVTVSVDSFPDRRFGGRVGFVSRTAEFTPSNVQTPSERSKQVFRIKVDLTDGLDVLRPGMAADVWLDEPPTGRER